jgi:hypothetical protein
MVMVIRGGVREGWPKTRKPRTMEMHGMCTRTIDKCHQRSAYSEWTQLKGFNPSLAYHGSHSVATGC